ncbi:hypothetical protein BCR39DRAFT_556489 [Naematelia encephala]|uniref:Uncharacterized protein n=1 Tax=Naematelia encephala TaxID=71784 RepID=A0A1Y2BJP4_9TREE|nr:hypothetical protein BCR39DRAFT_556489 [Naematelia encephala]
MSSTVVTEDQSDPNSETEPPPDSNTAKHEPEQSSESNKASKATIGQTQTSSLAYLPLVLQTMIADEMDFETQGLYYQLAKFCAVSTYRSRFRIVSVPDQWDWNEARTEFREVLKNSVKCFVLRGTVPADQIPDLDVVTLAGARFFETGVNVSDNSKVFARLR